MALHGTITEPGRRMGIAGRRKNTHKGQNVGMYLGHLRYIKEVSMTEKE